MFSPDAPTELALERERCLQGYRDRLLDGERFDFADIAWISQLATAGHVPARALLGRVANERRLAELHAESPGRFAEAATGVPRLAGWLAMAESSCTPLDVAALRRWLEVADPPCRAIGRAFAVLDELGIAPNARDLELFTLRVQRLWNHHQDDPRQAAELLAQLAENRLRNGSSPEGIALLRRAAAIGPGGARRWVWLYDFAERSECMQRWLVKYPTPSSRQPDALMWLALDYETGAADGKPDLDAAIRIYEMGTNVEAWAGEPGGTLRSAFCLAVGRWLTWRPRADEGVPREAALGWFERAIGRGDPAALGAWMLEAADGTSVVARDPAQVLAQVERYLAAEPAGISRLPLTHAMTLMLRQVQDVLRAGSDADVAPAAQRLRALVLLDDAEAQYLLGALLHNGKGIAQDREAGRRLLEAAAAQGQKSARETLEKMGPKSGSR